jgi:hypothetical protein
MLTTEDNPFDPFTEYNEWYVFDERSGYHTCAYLARIERTSDEMSEGDQAIAHEAAIDEIVEMNLLGIYKKVSRDMPDPGVTVNELIKG